MPEPPDSLHDPDATRAADPDATRRAAPDVRAEPRAGEFPGYRDVRYVSRGGFGAVYRARQEGTDRDVAIKVQLRGGAADDEAELDRLRFEREIQIAGQLRHPNIVPIFHAGLSVHGGRFFVMDFVDGAPLNRYVTTRRLTVEQVLDLMITVCDAVEAAHRRSIVHRDLKPANILVDRDGKPHVLDFGLARSVTDEQLTRPDHVMGTPAYMSPEQTYGDPGRLDTRTDVYSLGVILYQLLTGCFPYAVQGDALQVICNIRDATPHSMRMQWTPAAGATSSRRWRPCPIDDELETIVLRALAKDAGHRYSSPGALRDDLRRYLAGEPIEARRDSFWYVMSKLVRRNRGQSLVAASVFVIIGSAATVVGQFATMAAAEHAQGEHKDRLLQEELQFTGQNIPVAYLGWVLKEYSAGRIDVAKRLYAALARTPAAAQEPALAGMAYLLREEHDFDALVTGSMLGHEDLAHLIESERLRAAGDAAAAAEHFHRARRAARTPLVRILTSGS